MQYKLKLKNSVVDNHYPEKLDGSYIESLIYGLWKINVINLIKIKVSLAKEFHIQPSELEQMPYWEYELFLIELEGKINEENENQEHEMEKYHIKDNMKNIQKGNFKTPNIPKMPNISMPKF